jgi:hypothetical protein
MHRISNRFWKCFNKLPSHIQRVAEESFRLLKENPRHPSLHLKKWASYGPPGLVSIIELLQWKIILISFGSGLEATMNANK